MRCKICGDGLDFEEQAYDEKDNESNICWYCYESPEAPNG